MTLTMGTWEIGTTMMRPKRHGKLCGAQQLDMDLMLQRPIFFSFYSILFHDVSSYSHSFFQGLLIVLLYSELFHDYSLSRPLEPSSTRCSFHNLARLEYIRTSSSICTVSSPPCIIQASWISITCSLLLKSACYSCP
jgi:hypothetical protein